MEFNQTILKESYIISVKYIKETNLQLMLIKWNIKININSFKFEISADFLAFLFFSHFK